MIVLGLNAFGHDAAVVLLVDGRVAFAASEERFDRRRHSAAFPRRALEAALAATDVAPGDVDVVAFPWTRGMARGRKALHVLRHLPRSLAFLRERPDGALPGRMDYLRRMRRLPQDLRASGVPAPVVRVPHHFAHAVSATLALPEGRGAVLTADGMGEWTTTATWLAGHGGLRVLRRADYPHSAGKAYSAVTQWLGFRPESDEGKTMGLAAYGEDDAMGARFARGLLRPHDRRLLRVLLPAFDFPWGRTRLYGEAFVDSLGPARRGDEDLRPGDAHVARGIQRAVEGVVLAAAERLVEETHATTLGLAGGLFLNCALNGVLADRLPVEVLPFPVAGDAGAAWGAAAWVHASRTGRRAAPLTTLRLGTEIAVDDGGAVLGADAARPRDLAHAVADRVASGALVGVARGRAEFGPRALGARSLLASPTSIEVRDRVNRLKGREDWRPLAPVVEEGDATLFAGLGRSPWMILTFDATPAGRRLVPGAVHVDGTARVQTVNERDAPFLTSVLRALAGRGEPAAVLNTSFNRRGEPIVDTAQQALTSARAMKVDTVVVGDWLLDL